MFYVWDYSSHYYVAFLSDGMQMLKCDSHGKFFVKDDPQTSTSEGIHIWHNIMVNVIVDHHKIIVIVKI